MVIYPVAARYLPKDLRASCVVMVGDQSNFVIEDASQNLSLKLGQYNASLKAKTISLFDDKNDYVDKRGNSVKERDAVWTKLVQQFKQKVLK